MRTHVIKKQYIRHSYRLFLSFFYQLKLLYDEEDLFPWNNTDIVTSTYSLQPDNDNAKHNSY
jgi:hypothetical protein